MGVQADVLGTYGKHAVVKEVRVQLCTITNHAYVLMSLLRACPFLFPIPVLYSFLFSLYLCFHFKFRYPVFLAMGAIFFSQSNLVPEPSSTDTLSITGTGELEGGGIE